jgi:hypothetical protein
MVSANNHCFGNIYRWVLSGLIVMTAIACTKLDKPEGKKPPRPSAEAIKFEPRDSLQHWYDETYKIYYGLKGPVESLVISPAKTSAGEVTSDGWKLWFNKRGRLTRKQRMAPESEPAFETIYEYDQVDYRLLRITSSVDNKLWRSTEYIYESGQLVRVEYTDHSKNDRFRVKRSRQQTVAGWIDAQLPVEKIEMPRYSEFSRDGMLVWSNKGDINNGLGELYFIRTVDGVTSSSLVNQNTEKITGIGGYRYQYYDNGLLRAVESYNAHNNRLFHITTYKYDDLWLLSEENRQVKDSSAFNQVIPEQVDYEYYSIDVYGNWLQRTLRYVAKYKQQSYQERRSIIYFQDLL